MEDLAIEALKTSLVCFVPPMHILFCCTKKHPMVILNGSFTCLMPNLLPYKSIYIMLWVDF
jgi:hypothetical protein